MRAFALSLAVFGMMAFQALAAEISYKISAPDIEPDAATTDAVNGLVQGVGMRYLVLLIVLAVVLYGGRFAIRAMFGVKKDKKKDDDY